MNRFLLPTLLPSVPVMQQAMRLSATLFRRSTLLQLLLVLGLLGWAHQSMGQTIVGFDVSGLANGGPATLPASTTATNVTAGSLTKSAGVTTGSANNTFGGTGWSRSTDPASITGNANLTFTVKANSGYTLSLSAISPLSYQRSATGPSNGLIQYQIDGGSFVNIGTPVAFTNGSATLAPIDLSGIAALQNLPSSNTVTFKIIPYGGSGAAGTWYISNSGTPASNPDLAVTGTVACPTITATLAGTSTICSGASATLAATITGGTSPYTVRVNDGSSNTTITNYTSGSAITITPATSKTYTITLVRDANNCTATVSGSGAAITVAPNPVAAITNLASDYCKNAAAVTLTGTPTGAGFMGAFTVDGVTATVFDPASLTLGQHTVVYSVTNTSSCSATTSQTVRVRAVPNPNITGLANNYCRNEAPVTLTGTPADGDFTIDGIAATTFDPASLSVGQHTVIYSVTNTSSCSATTSQTVRVRPVPTPVITGSLTVCAGSSTTLTASGGDTYLWSNNATSASIVVPAGTYSVTATNNPSGCFSTTSVTVTDVASPTATLTGTATVCTGSSANLTATLTGGTGSYSLTYSDGTSTTSISGYTNGAAIAVSPAVSTTYTLVAVADANGCVATSSGTAVVTVNPQPSVASAGASQTITPGGTATLSANAPTVGTGEWSVASGPSMAASQFSSTTSPTATFTPTGGLGAYVLTWTISNAPCTPSSSNVTITVAQPTCGTLTVPGNYSSIQAAIDAACPGTLIQVAGGTYTEQLTISKSLSIVGAGLTTIIQAPATLAVGGPDEGAPYIKRNIVEIKGTSAVTLSGLKVNGPVTGQDGCGTDAFGIYVYDNSSLALSNAAITNAQLSDPSLFGCQVGFALGVGLTGSPGSATLTNVTMSNYQKGGILARGAGTVLVADNITVTGIGATTATAQNGVQVSSGASATITNSSITNNSYVTPTGSTFYTASGIITYNSGPVTISGSTFTGNDVGLDAEGTGTTNVTNNTFSQSSYASIYTDQVMTLTSSGNTFDKQVTNSAKTGTIYSTIQAAIDDASANDVLTAAAGTFAEDIYIDKAVTLHGANTGIDPNTGSRVAETIIVPATAGSDVFYLADGLTGVTIDGFTIDGNNPALNGTTINGSNVDASTGISSYSSVVSSVKINNNIIQNFADYGIVLDPSSNGGVPATGGHEITHNKIDNIGQGSGIGVLLQNNAYTVVTNNVISRIRSGIQTGNFYQTAPAGTTPSLSNNQISAQRAGIFHNLQYSAATPFTVANNTLSVDASGASFSVVPRSGILLISLGVPTAVSSNTVNGGFISGVEALNNVGNVTLSGGTVQGNTSGILLTNKDVVGNTASTGSKLLVSGVTVSNSPIGIKVFDDPTAPAGPNASITVTGNTQITGSGAFTAVAISGVDASATITGNASSFVGNGSGTGVDINGGSASVTADRITNFTTGINVSNGGQLTNAANNFIINNGTGVAYAADASATQGTVTNNDLSGNTGKAITNGIASTTIGATCNWYGTTNVDGQAATLFTGAVIYSPYLNSGTDNDNDGSTGFQPAPNTCVTNQPPVASIIANQTATVGQAYSFTVPAFSDPENMTLTYTASISPANGLTFDPATRVISGTPTTTGVSNITVTATDPASMSASTTFTITVNQPTCGTLTVPGNYSTIQAAIDAACPGAVIQVTAGTYTEQLLISKNLSIVGVGSGNPIVQAPGILTAGSLSGGHRNIVEINNGAVVTITGINVNGPVSTTNGCSDSVYGININGGAGLNLSNASVTNVYLTPTTLGGCQSGIGIRAGFNALGSPGSLTTTNVTVSGYQKAGIIIDGAGSDGKITTTIVTGAGPTTVIAQNGIQISRGATGNVLNSTITSNSYTDINNTDTQSAGLLAYNSGVITATGNTLSGNNAGIYAFADAGTPGLLTANNNVFSNNDYASIYTEAPATFAGSGNTFDKQVTNNNRPGTVYSTIQLAVNKATAGDVISAATGTYPEAVTVNKSLTINGANAGTPGFGTRVGESIIDGGGSRTGLVIAAANVFIDGFKFIGGAGTYGAAVAFNGSQPDAQVINSIFTDNVIGITEAPANTSIKHNLFDGNNRAGAAGGSGVYTDVLTNGLTITDNEFKNHLNNSAVIFGASAANTHQNLTFSQNYIHDNNASNSMVYSVAVSGGNFAQNTITQPGATALKFAGANSSITVQHNFLDNNGVGIRIADDGYGLGSDGPIAIHYNSLTNCTTLAIDNQEASLVDANCNWFGTQTVTAANVSGNVSTTQVLANGTDEAPGTPGFQNTSCFTPPTMAPVLTISPAPQLGPNTSYCIGENPTVTSNYTTGTNSFTVQARSDGSTTVTTGNSVTITQGAGAYDIFATNSQNGYTSPVSTTFVQIEPVVTNFVSDKAAYCVGETVSLTALGCNVTASSPNLYKTLLRSLDGSNNENQGTVFLPDGVTSYTYTQFATTTPTTYTITAECVNTGTGQVCGRTQLVIQANPQPVATLVSSNTLTCAAPTATLTAGGGQSYAFAGPGVVSQNGSATALVNASGMYSVTVTSAAGCVSTTTTTVSSDTAVPTATLMASNSLNCAVTSATLTANASGGTSYTYTFSNGATQIGTTNQAVATTGGSYSVTVTTANGCSTVASTTIMSDTAAPAVTLVSNNTLTCSVTSATLTATGGVSYAFSGPGLVSSDPVAGTAVVNASGTYSVTATAPNGCLGTTTTSVISNTIAPTATLTTQGSSTLTCAQTSVTLVAGGGVSYAFSGTGIISQDPSGTAVVNTRGVYSVTATAANGCTDVATIRIFRDTDKPTATLATQGSSTLTCAQTSVTLTASATGGTAPYTYLFSPDATTITATQATVTTAGLYSVTAIGANGCFDVANVRVFRDAGKPTAALTASNSGTLTCNQTSLTLTASATGGSTPHTYLFSPDATTISATQATVTTAGLYSVTAIGANGCFDVANVRVYRDLGKPTAALTASGSGTLTCNQTSLTLTASATGGSTPYTYLFSADATPISATAATVTTAGLYSVTAIGSNGCTDVASVRVYRDTNRPTATLTTAGSSTLTCAQTSVTLVAGGGVSYAFSGTGIISQDASGTAVVNTRGVYSVTATAANGCSDVATIRISSDTDKPTASLATVGGATITCNQPSVTLTASATGSSSYTYAFSAGATPIGPNQATVSMPGVYTVTVTGANGCTDVATERVFRDVARPTASLMGTTTICAGGTANLVATVSGGTTPYSLTYSDGTSASAISNYTSGTNIPVSPTATSTYTIAVSGANGCTATITGSGATVTVNPLPNASLTTQGSSTLTCAQTSVTLVAGGGASYAFAGPGIVSRNGNTAIVNAAGTYSVTVTSAAGCSALSTTMVSSNTVAPTVSLVASGTISCASPSVTLTANTGTRSDTYAFSGPNGVIPSMGNTAVVSTGGIYSVTATSTNGCTSTTTTTVASDTAVPSATLVVSGAITCASPTATLTANPATRSGTDTYAFSGPSGPVSSTGNTATVMAVGIYSVTVTSSNGCLSTATTSVVSDTAVTSLTLTSSNNLSCGVTSATLTANLDPAVRVTSYSYVFSTGAAQIGTSNRAIVTTGGPYSVTATSANNGCSVSATTNITSDTALPTATLISSNSLNCGVTSATLTANIAGRSGTDTFAFSTGASQIGTSNQAIVTTGGPYSVTVTATNGCTNVATTTVASDTAVPSATLVVSGAITCASPTATLTANPAARSGTDTYAFAGPSGPVSSTGNTATVMAAGTYSVTVTSANGCLSTAMATVVSNTVVSSLTLTSSNNLSCGVTSATLTANLDPTGSRSVYTYAFSPGATQLGNTRQATVTTAGLYSVTATASNGCSTVASTSVTSDTAVTSLTLTSSNDLSCGVTSATLTASPDPAVRSAYTYVFSAGATQISTNQATVTTAGLYSVTATSVSNGCSVSATTTVTSSTVAPTVSLVSSGTISCTSPSVTLTANTGTPADVYAFAGPNGPIPSMGNTAVVNAGGLYSVTATSTNSCFSTTTTTVASDTAVPTATLTSSGMLGCNQSSVTLTAGGGQSYFFNGPGIVSQSASGSAVVNAAGTYSVTATNTTTGCFSSTSINVMAEPVPTLATVSQVAAVCPGTPATINLTGLPENATLTVGYSINGIAQPPVSVTTSNSSMGWRPADPIPFQTRPLTVTDNGAPLTINSIAFSGGCSQTFTAAISLTVNPAPTATLVSSGNLSCAQTSVTLTAGGGTAYAFSGPNFTQSGPSNTAVVSQAGTYSVIVTGTGGCTATQTTTVISSTTLVAPDFATRGNQTIADGLTNVTVIQNSPSVSFAATNCAGTLNWSGNGLSGMTTLNAPTTAIGVFVYQATCTVGNCVSNPTSVTLTVNPVPVTTNLTVLSRDPENGNLNTNTIKPYLLLQNDGSTPIPYGELTVRYYLTVENNVPLRFDINYAQMGNDKVHLQYVPLNPARQGASGYIEFSFDASAGSLAPMSNAVIQDLVNKQDYSMFFQGDDYSYANNANFTPNTHITAYRNGVLVYGVEPVPTGPPTPLTLTASANPTTILTTGSTQLQANVSGGTPNYTYAFNGPGSIQTSGNTATVSGLSAGVQTFTVTVTDATSPVNQTIATTVSVTVTAPANQAPVATANANQTATQGMQFSYTANAFTDETPNSLTYTASINPANGFTFNPATRVIQGTPQNTGVSSVTITATDPGGLSASTVFTITVNAQPVAPTALTLTASASPTTILTTGSTQLQANVSGGTPGYTYAFNGPGSIQTSGNTATVSGLSAGVQTFTVTARDATSPVNQTIATTVSVTVTAPANQAPVATANANQTATQGVPFSYTANAFTDETPNSLTYTASINPANGFTFNPATRVIQGTPQNTGVSSVTITATDPGGLSASTVFTITVSASAVATATNLTVYSRDPDNGQLNTNTLKPYLQLQNDGNTPIPYGELTVRYWLTVENPAPLRFDINYAQLGSDKVHLNYVPVSPLRQGASGYIEFSFDASAGSLGAMSNSGPIQDLINKQDYSYFFQGDDYSYVNNGNFTPNPHITAYRNGVLVYGVEPPVNVRIAAEQADASLHVEVLGNPLVGGELAVKVTGAAGQSLRLRVTDLNGHLVNERTVERAGTVEEQRLSVSQQAAGLLFLQVSTPNQTVTVKVLKAD